MQVIANSRLPARSFIDRLRSMARASFERLEFEQQAEELKWPLQRTGNLPNQESLEKLLKLCEQKHGRDAPAMRQLRRQLDAIRKPELKAMQQFATGRGMPFQAVPINTPVLESPKLSVDTVQLPLQLHGSSREGMIRYPDLHETGLIEPLLNMLHRLASLRCGNLLADREPRS